MYFTDPDGNPTIQVGYGDTLAQPYGLPPCDPATLAVGQLVQLPWGIVLPVPSVEVA